MGKVNIYVKCFILVQKLYSWKWIFSSLRYWLTMENLVTALECSHNINGGFLFFFFPTKQWANDILKELTTYWKFFSNKGEFRLWKKLGYNIEMK